MATLAGLPRWPRPQIGITGHWAGLSRLRLGAQRRNVSSWRLGRDQTLKIAPHLDSSHVTTKVEEQQGAVEMPFILASGYGAADLHAEPVLGDAVNVGKPSRSGLLLTNCVTCSRARTRAALTILWPWLALSLCGHRAPRFLGCIEFADNALSGERGRHLRRLILASRHLHRRHGMAGTSCAIR